MHVWSGFRDLCLTLQKFATAVNYAVKLHPWRAVSVQREMFRGISLIFGPQIWVYHEDRVRIYKSIESDSSTSKSLNHVREEIISLHIQEFYV